MLVKLQRFGNSDISRNTTAEEYTTELLTNSENLATETLNVIPILTLHIYM